MGGEAKGKMDGGKYDNILIKLRIIIKLPVNPNVKLSLHGGFEVRAKLQASYNLRVCMQAYKLPAHFVWATIWVH